MDCIRYTWQINAQVNTPQNYEAFCQSLENALVKALGKIKGRPNIVQNFELLHFPKFSVGGGVRKKGKARDTLRVSITLPTEYLNKKSIASIVAVGDKSADELLTESEWVRLEPLTLGVFGR